MVRVQNYECVACAWTGATNTYTKYNDNENPFLDTQMFVQERNNEYEYDKGTKNVLNTTLVTARTLRCRNFSRTFRDNIFGQLVWTQYVNVLPRLSF